MCGCLLHAPNQGTWPATQACALTGIQTGDPLGHRPAINPLSYTSQGQVHVLNTRLSEVFQVMKGKDLHPRLLYLAKLSFRSEGQIKCFPDKVKLKEFIITQPLLYEMLKGLI